MKAKLVQFLLPRRSLNIKLLGCLVGGCALFGVGMHYLHGYQVGRSAGLLLHQADKAAAASDTHKAVDYLARYLGLVPADADAQARYAMLLADEKLSPNPRALMRASFALERALLLDGQRQD